MAIDIGGTKLVAGLVDEDGTVLSRATAATPVTSASEELFGIVAALVAEHDVREDAARAEGECRSLPVVHGHAGHVRGEQIGRELDSMPIAVE